MKLTRRAALGGALGALFGTAARAEPFRLVAGEIFPSSYDGYLPGVPGPPLRVVAGEPFRVLLVNKLPAATTLVLPGGAFPGLGAPSVAPGASAEFEMAPRAPGFWLYGDYDDMVGPLIVDEAKPPPVDHDVLMAFGSDTGRRFETAAPPAGRVRLRLANARADSTVFLRAHGAKVQIVAIDGQGNRVKELRDKVLKC
jgi:FtsP/CotA-like multicopper oxidase with cupredoxin domain